MLLRSAVVSYLASLANSALVKQSPLWVLMQLDVVESESLLPQEASKIRGRKSGAIDFMGREKVMGREKGRELVMVLEFESESGGRKEGKSGKRAFLNSYKKKVADVQFFVIHFSSPPPHYSHSASASPPPHSYHSMQLKHQS